MFAGMPGIGVGTLFYVLIAIWMPIREIAVVAQGRSSWARWRLIGVQLVYASGIIASVALADRMLLWMLGGGRSRDVGPARWLNDQLGAHAPQSILAAPIATSFILLAAVLLTVQILRMLRLRSVPGVPTKQGASVPGRLRLKEADRPTAADR
jgi:hypothetical protein